MKTTDDNVMTKVKKKVASSSSYPCKFDVLIDAKTKNPVISIHCKDSFDGGHVGISKSENGSFTIIVEHDKLNKTIVRQALKNLTALTNIEYEVEFAQSSDKSQKHENYEWVRGIIASCSNEGQFEIALNVITQYHRVYKDKTYFDSLMALWKQEEMRLDDNMLKRKHQLIVQAHGEMKLDELSKNKAVIEN